MEENKEFLTSENSEENENVELNSETDVADNAQNSSSDESASEQVTGEFADELAEIEENAPTDNEEAVQKDEKKNHFLQLPIIISLIIVVGVVLGFLVFKCFFDTSIVGTWVIEDDTEESSASDDEASSVKTYYIFDDDGVVSLAYGTMEYVGTYSVSDNEVTMEITSAYLSASFEYSVTGNIFTGRTLTFTDSSSDVEYTFHSDKREVPDLKVDEDFEPDDMLTDDWNYYDGYYDFSYSFNSDGTVSINQNDMLFVDGVYNYTDDTITITYFAGTEQTMEMEYTVDEDSLILNGLQYFRVGSASADEAREAVSDYY